MKKIYLIDYIGIHSGMNYYLDSFKSALTQRGFEVHILSNFTDEVSEKPFFLNHYKGNSIRKAISLIINLVRLKRFVTRNDSIAVYDSFGNFIDILFIKILCGMPNHVIDVHEAIAQSLDQKASLRNKFKNLYSQYVKTVISHSERTDNFLKEYGFKGKRFNVPHFKYDVDNKYDIANAAEEVKNAIDSQKTNILFFGNINESKGIDILMEALNMLPSAEKQKVNVIIAGKNIDGSVSRITLDKEIKHSFILKFINDDELKYLYDSCDYVALPYRKTSQSGILEMALNFRKPIIATDIPYFRKTLKEFPSFGILSGQPNVKTYSATLKDILSGKYTNTTFYTKADYDRYTNRAEVTEFFDDFSKWISKL